MEAATGTSYKVTYGIWIATDQHVRAQELGRFLPRHCQLRTCIAQGETAVLRVAGPEICMMLGVPLRRPRQRAHERIQPRVPAADVPESQTIPPGKGELLGELVPV